VKEEGTTERLVKGLAGSGLARSRARSRGCSTATPRDARSPR
jgi:hypothetical protein